MAVIIPFRGLRPRRELASRVASLPYDVVSVAEAATVGSDPLSFFHVTRSEIDLPGIADVHSPEVYEKARQNLDQMVRDEILVQDAAPRYYIYELVMDGRAQTGLVCGSSIDDYDSGVLKRHEFTRPEKEQDRVDHIRATGAQTGIVFLACRDSPSLDEVFAAWKAAHAPVYDFIAAGNISHRLWVVDDDHTIGRITDIFGREIAHTYIADGHHRAASAARVRHEMQAQHPAADGSKPWNYFITCIFPEGHLQIMDYNRVVKDLGAWETTGFLAALEKDFLLEPAGNNAVKPTVTHQFGLYLEGAWYRLTAKPGTFTTDPIGILDVTVLQQNILEKLLGIIDPRTDKRLDFVGGIRGLGELESRVNSGEARAAFSLYPVSLQQLFDIADSGNTMPPKSTWFEPKLRDGLVVYLLQE